MYTASVGDKLGEVLVSQQNVFPELTIGAALRGYATTPDEWKWGTLDITCAGGSAADQALVAAVAGKKIQLVITNITVQPVTGDNMQPIQVTIQDSDNLTLSGAAVFVIPTFYKTQIGIGGGQYVVPWMGAVCYSATANRAIEADVAGGAGAEHVIITYAWREFA